MKNPTKILLGVIVIIVAIFIWTQMPQESPIGNGELGDYDEFAQCLADNGAKMYGAYWCGHCKNQKEAFGSSFQYVDYTECDAEGEGGDPEACQTAGISGYPTWVFADGTKSPGKQSFSNLASKTGCAIS